MNKYNLCRFKKGILMMAIAAPLSLLNQFSYAADDAPQGHHMMQMQDHHMMMNMSKDAAFDVLQLPKGEPLKSLPVVKNTSKTPQRFEATLTAKPVDVELVPGHKTQFWLYNDTMLPLIDIAADQWVKITFNNQLAQDSTIHWHGLAVPASQDGNPQDPVASGTSRDYIFYVDKNMAGTHWFHPHAHKVTAEQVYRGLAGAFIIRDPNDPLKNMPEQNLFMSDLRLDQHDQIPSNTMFDVMNGREGQYALVNGQNQPVITLDGTQRWRIWNGNSARYLNLSFPADQVEAYLVGNDGGLIEAPRAMTSILLTPGERAEIVLTPKKEGQFELTALAYDRHKMGTSDVEKDRVLATVNMKLGQKIDLPTTLRKIADLPKPVVKRTLEYSESGMNFYINKKSHDLNRNDIVSKVDQVEEWEIFNNSHMDHNFHLHGTHFMVKEFELNGEITQPEFKLVKDTINLKPYEKIRILVVQHERGLRMYHCHILEHEDVGMMGQQLVE